MPAMTDDARSLRAKPTVTAMIPLKARIASRSSWITDVITMMIVIRYTTKRKMVLVWWANRRCSANRPENRAVAPLMARSAMTATTIAMIAISTPFG